MEYTEARVKILVQERDAGLEALRQHEATIRKLQKEVAFYAKEYKRLTKV